MISTKSPPISCTPQHFPTGRPSNEWTPEELTIYAQAQYDAIRDDERHLAAKYWRLGLALNLLRRTFNHGQWERVLNELKIEKTKAARARAIAKTFAEEQDVAGLTVQEAYGRRKRKERSSPSAPSRRNNQRAGLTRFLKHVATKADFYIDEAAFADKADTPVLLDAVNEAINKLQQIRSHIEQQVTEP